MIPWVQLGSAMVPGGGGELRLMRRGTELSIMLERTELMNSRRSGSEEALATLTHERLRDRQKPQILIGGLGMGFTLRTAMAEFGADAHIVVAELVPEIVAWARGPMSVIFGDCLADKRVSVHEGDVGNLIRSKPSAYDAILLDVDNGPEGLTHSANGRLYDSEGLDFIRTALRDGGILAVWSAGPDESFTRRLHKAGFAVEEIKVRARGKSGARQLIWVATAP